MTRTILSDPRLEKWNLQDRLNIGIGAWETVGNHSHRTTTVLPSGSLLKKMIRHTVAVAESIQAVEQSSAVPQPPALLKKTKKEPADQARDIHEYIALLQLGTNKGGYEGFVDMGDPGGPKRKSRDLVAISYPNHRHGLDSRFKFVLEVRVCFPLSYFFLSCWAITKINQYVDKNF